MLRWSQKYSCVSAGAHNASQSIIVSNCTFTDCSGGAIKLGDVGERGAPSPGAATPPAQQDRGFLVSDNYIHDMPLVGRTSPDSAHQSSVELVV